MSPRFHPVTRHRLGLGERTDERGRAYAGSRLQVQCFVSRHRSALSDAVRRALGLTGEQVLEWRAPLEEKCFAEPSDFAFLRALDLGQHCGALKRFWPTRGPHWDALARVTPPHLPPGVVLVEAKSYPGELYGRGCQAADRRSAEQIMHSLGAAKAWFGADAAADWCGRPYQYANRLAHVYFLRERCRLSAWLVNLCFLDDLTRTPTGRATWDAALPAIKAELGFDDGRVPFTADVFLPARPSEELFRDVASPSA